VIRPPNWLGDAILAVPAMTAIRDRFPAAYLTVAASASVAALFREDTPVRPDRVLDLASSTRLAVPVLEQEGFDLGVLFPNSFRSAWQFWRAGIPERWGYASSGRRWLLTRRAAKPSRGEAAHQRDYYSHLARALGCEVDPSVLPSVAPRGPSKERAAALLAQHHVDMERPLVGFAPGAAYGQAKQWPPARVAEVIAHTVRAHDATCVIFGADHDRDAARAIESWLRAHAADTERRVVNLAGRSSLGALVGLVQRMTVFVSNDSGAMHLAAALGRPVVAIFGPTDERATRPLGDHTVLTASVFCRPCLLRDCPIDHRCMKRISPDMVSAAVTATLADGR
jgi:heptosyltransferase-2